MPQPRAPFGLFWPGWHLSQTSTQKPYGYCFASAFVPISDENRDGLPVAFRDFTEKPAPYPASGPHSPSKVGNARAADASVSCPRKKRAIPETCLAG